MRQTKFRGLSAETPTDPRLIDKGEWVFGSLFHDTRDDTYSIWDESLKYWVRVDPSTVGQLTGLLDKNGNEIYEGDILEKLGISLFEDEPNVSITCNPVGRRDVATMLRFPTFWLENESFGYEGEDLENNEEWGVVGSIHDHSELIKTNER